MKYFYKAKIDRIIDGDTIDMIIDLGFNIHHKIRVRLAAIDTPEIRTLNLKEKQAGIAAKNYVSAWLENYPHVYVHTTLYNSDKYGRTLGVVYADENMRSCLNKDILSSGFGAEYK